MKAAAKGNRLSASGIFMLAAIIGGVGGLLGAGFQKGVRGLWSLLMGQGESIVEAARGLTTLEKLLIPAAGGLVAGLFLLLIRNKRSPFGIADIVGLVALRRGTIRLRESTAQILSSACTIGTGGSIGREGANSQIAATIGAGLSRLFKTSSRTRAVLLGCGVSAGMACSYNAPIAAAIFVMEAVLGNFAMDVFAPIVVASVFSTMVRRWLIEPGPLYELPNELTLDWRLVLVALVLGVICGFGGIAFRRSLKLGRAAFSYLRLPLFLRMGVGGLIVGAIGIRFPEVWGNGFEVIQDTIVGKHGELGSFLGLVFSIMLLKVVATACTAGSGGLGGVFTPNLVVGAAFGAFIGSAVLWLVPEMGDHRSAFALVGMAGLCAATMHAPITAVVLVFELTSDYGLILPLMLCSIVASIFARLLDEDSYYSEHLRAQGQEIPTGLEELAIKSTYVRDIMRRDLVKLRETATFDEVLDVFTNSRRDTVYVLDADDALLGHIHLHDVKNFINDPSLSSVVIAADLTRAVPTVTADESLASILGRFDDPELGELAVATTDPRPRLSGRVTRRDLIACLSEEVLGHRKLRAKFRVAGRQEADFVQLPEGYVLDRVTVPEDYQGRALDSLDLQGQAGLTVLLVVRSLADGTEERLAAEPQVVIEPGTDLVVLGRSEAIDAFKKLP
jgi:CIC family chloride channel protein